MTNSATAVAVTPPVRTAIRWDVPSWSRRTPASRPPFVIVVMRASAPVRAVPGEAVPGQAVPREAVPGEAVPGEAVPGEAVPGQAVPREAVPREAVPGQAVPGQTVPGQTARGGEQTAEKARVLLEGLVHRTRVPLDAGPVHLTGELGGVLLDVVRPTSLLDRAAARRALPGLHRVGGRRDLGRSQVDQALALRDGVGRRQLTGGAHEQRLDLVRRQVRTLLQQQRRGARDDGGRLRRAGAAEEPLAGTRTRVRGVDLAAGDPEADDGLAGRDDVGVADAVTRGRPVGDDVVVRRGRATPVRTADGDHVRVVGRVVELRRAVALVTGGHDDDDALEPGLLSRVGQRVQLVGLDAVGT